MEDAAQASAPALTSQQMLERNIVPVKAEYLVRKGQPNKQASTEPSPSPAQGATPPTALLQANGSGKEAKNDQDQSKGKARKQMRKDVRSGRQADLCINFALGRCTFGDRCKFGHDATEYLNSKPADLPGTCPWTAVQATCPYGIMCRYATTHGSVDDLHKLLASLPGPDATTTPSEAPCILPPPKSIEKETNFLGKDVQAMLWKNRYDYTRADEILKSMDIRISFKRAPKPLPGGAGGGAGAGGGGEKKSEEGKAGKAAERSQGEMPPAPAQAPGEVPAGGEQAGAKAAEEPQPMQTDADGAAAAAAVSGSGDGAEDNGSTDGPAPKRQRIGDGGDAEAEAPPPPAATETAASVPAGSDAAAVAALAAEQKDGTAATGGTAAVEAVEVGVEKEGGTLPATEAKEEVVAAATTRPETATTEVKQEATATAPAPASAPAATEAKEEARAAHVEVPLRLCEKRVPDFRGKTYLAPLTTVGNLPFRRVCKALGVDVTCGEMALATNLLQGQASEWALMKRHPCEDFFGVQVCGGYPDALARVGQLLGEQLQVDFVDINMGCPIDLVCDKSAGSALLRQPRRIEQILRATSAALGDTPLTYKTRKGYNDGEDVAHTFLHKTREWGAAAVTLHGRTRQQRYSKLADWDYIKRCGKSCSAAGVQLIGNGDVFSYLDWNQHMEQAGGHLATLMIGRGALIKPWIFTEIKEQRHWDISASERLDLYKQFCSAGLEHWGSDSRGVETTRRFLLEWLSFTCRYVPVGLLDVVPQHMNHRPPAYCGRSDLETLLASDNPQDWVRISEMLLGPPPAPINFNAKHKSNSYGAAGMTSELDMARG